VCCPAAKEEGAARQRRTQFCTSQRPWRRRNRQVDGHHQPTASPGSPVTVAGRRRPTLEAAALQGELLQKTLSPGELMKCCKKFSWAMSYF